MYNQYSAVVFVQMLIICALVVIQKGEKRKIIAFLFATLLIAHDQAFKAIYVSSGELAWFVYDNPIIYNATDVLCSLIIINIIAMMVEPPSLAGDIQYIALISIPLNGISWLMAHYKVQNEMIISSALFGFVYGVAIILLTMRETRNVGINRIDTRFHVFHPRSFSSHIINHSN